MPLLPEEIPAQSFRRRPRGYDRRQVDAFLDRAGRDYAGALERIGALDDDGGRARAERDELDRRLTALTATQAQTAETARRDADADAAAVRRRAEQAAALIVRQAEEAAEACARRADALRAGAQADTDAARQRLEDADQRARELEAAARDRWDAVRAETEARFAQLQLAERRFAERVRRVEAALGALRSQVTLLDQVRHVEEVLTGLRADIPPFTPAAARNGNTATEGG
jgi:DivIVA domain-containing protein